MNRCCMAPLLAGLLTFLLTPAGPATAQSGRGRQFAVPPAYGPARGATPLPGFVPAQPVAPQVPGVLGNDLPPRYDGLALGHGQFSNQIPPPIPDRPALSPRQYQRDLLGENEGFRGSYGTDIPGYAATPGIGYGDVPYGAVPYPVPRAATPSDSSFGSSAQIDGE